MYSVYIVDFFFVPFLFCVLPNLRSVPRVTDDADDDDDDVCDKCAALLQSVATRVFFFKEKKKKKRQVCLCRE